MGPATYALLKNLISPAKPSDKSFKELCDTLDKHLSPKPIVIAERFRFYKRDQLDSEQIKEYVAELKKLSVKCNFGDFLDDALRDKLVCGLRNTAIQERLLSIDQLNFSTACQNAVMLEQATTDAKQLQSKVPSGPSDVHAIEGGAGGRTLASNCSHCNRCHNVISLGSKIKPVISAGRKFISLGLVMEGKKFQ